MQQKTDNNKPEIIWAPLPGSQTLALSCPAQIILYHGTRGPGKTDAQLMRFRRHVGQGFGKHWRGVIFDREYKNLDDLVAKSMRWFPEFKDGARFLSSKSDYRWTWPTGEQLLFRTAKRPQDYWAYHGQEFPFIGWNELTKYPTDELFEMMMSCNRSSYLAAENPLIIDGDIYKRTGQIVFIENEQSRRAMKLIGPEIPLEVFATTNPFGPGHNWVKERFIDAAPMGRLVRKSINVFNPQTKEREDFVTTQVHLFGSYRENRYLSPKYIAELNKITDKNKRKAWLGGSWDVVSGGMFDDIWDSDYHKIKRFTIPLSWRITRSFDWGSSKPFSVGFWAISDGTDYIDGEGKRRSSVRGDVFRIGEWYGCEEGKQNVGLKMLASTIALGIVKRQIAMGIDHRMHPGPADGSIYDVENGSSIAADMSKPVRLDANTLHSGVEWLPADKSAGSRIHGWEAIREYLQGAIPPEHGPREYPGMFIFEDCKSFMRVFPNTPRDEVNADDVDTEYEDHIPDEVRYFVLSQGQGGRQNRTKGT